MKIHEYNEMMAYLTRPATRQTVASGGRIGFYKGASLAFKYGQRIKDLWLEGKTTKVINEILKFVDDKTTTIDNLIQSMKDSKSGSPITITEKELKTRPDLSGITTGGKLPYIRDPEISKRIIDAANAGEDTIEGFLRKNPDLNKTSFYDFLKRTDTEWKSKGKGKPPFKKEVTDDIIKVENFLKENPITNIESIATGTGIPLTKINNVISAYKKSFVEPRPNFIPNKSFKNLVNKIKTNASFGFEQVLDQLLIKNGINPNKVSKETKNKLTKSRKAVSEFFEGGTNFEHTLPKSLIKYIDNPDKKVELLLTGSRTSPELNQFKRRYDNLLRGAVSKLKGTSKDKVKYTLKEYNDEVKRIRDEVKDATGGYEIGYLKFDNTGKATAVLPKGSKSLLKTKGGLGPETSQKLSPFENAKYHNNLIENYNKNPNSEIFNTLREYEPDPTKLTLFKDQQKAYEQVNKYLKMPKKKFMEFANKNIDNPAVQAIFKSPYGKATAVTAASLVPSKLAAGEVQMPQGSPGQINPETEEGFSTGEKLAGAGAAAGTAYKFGKPILKTLGKIARPFGRVLGAPSVGGGLALNEFLNINPFSEEFGDLKEDPNYSIAGADLLLPELAKKVGVRGALANPFGIGRFMTPVGTALITGDTLAKRAKQMMETSDEISDMEAGDEQDSLLEEYAAKDYRGYDKGGIVSLRRYK